jgi:predicted ATPase
MKKKVETDAMPPCSCANHCPPQKYGPVKNKHVGGRFDDFLKEEGILEEVTAAAKRKSGKTVRRVCLYGGPGSGKSTACAYIFHELKTAGYNVEQVQEYIKTWAYEGRPPYSFDQWYVFGKQMHREDVVLRPAPKTGKPIVDVVVTDSPPLLGCTYAAKFDVPGWEHLVALSNIFEKTFDSVNIFVQRPATYQTEGRYQTADEAKQVDEHIKKMLDIWGVEYYTVPVEDKDKLMKIILAALGTPKERKCRKRGSAARVTGRPKKLASSTPRRAQKSGRDDSALSSSDPSSSMADIPPRTSRTRGSSARSTRAISTKKATPRRRTSSGRRKAGRSTAR